MTKTSIKLQLLSPGANSGLQALYPPSSYLGVARSLGPTSRALGQANRRNVAGIGNPYSTIRPSVYKLLKRKKPLDRFMKRPFVEGRYADPLFQRLPGRADLKVEFSLFHFNKECHFRYTPEGLGFLFTF